MTFSHGLRHGGGAVAPARRWTESLEEAAMDLGARPAKVFFLITLPMIAPALLRGLAAGVHAVAGRPGDRELRRPVRASTTLPMVIFSKVRLGVSPDINALATILVLVVATFTAVFGIWMQRQQKRRELDMQRAIATNE